MVGRLTARESDGDTVAVSAYDSDIVQRVLTVGVRASSVVDLATISFSRRAEDVSAGEASSRKLLQRFQSLRGLSEASRADLTAATGMDDFEVLRCQAMMEIGRRMAMAGAGPRDTIETADDVVSLLDHLRYEKREHFVAILLDAKSNVIRVAPIHVGTLTASLVGPREVFREAIRDGAASVIVVHNHPSGDPTPSPEDVDVTDRLAEIGAILDIPVLDHVIIGERSYRSFRQMGRLRVPKGY